MKTNINVSRDELSRVLSRVVGTKIISVVFRRDKTVTKLNAVCLGQTVDQEFILKSLKTGVVTNVKSRELLAVYTNGVVLRYDGKKTLKEILTWK